MFWKIYYSDETTISSKEASPFELDRRSDVQVIVQKSPEHNWITRSGSDYYVWDNRDGEARWWGVDIFGLHHYLLQPGARCVLFGVTIGNDRFRKIFDRARSEFGNKEAFMPNERHPG